MAMKARPPDQLLDPKEAAALKMLFESGYDYINSEPSFTASSSRSHGVAGRTGRTVAQDRPR